MHLVRALVLVGSCALLAGCQYLADQANLRGFQSDLSRLLAKSDSSITLSDCRLFDNDSFAPAGTCLAKGTIATVATLTTDLGLLPLLEASNAEQPDTRGCKALKPFNSAGTEAYMSKWSGRADFHYLALFFDRTRARICFEARYAWG